MGSVSAILVGFIWQTLLHRLQDNVNVTSKHKIVRQLFIEAGGALCNLPFPSKHLPALHFSTLIVPKCGIEREA